MMHPVNGTYRVGDAEITRIDETTLRGFTAATLYAGSDADVLARLRGKRGSRAEAPENEPLALSTHAWLVRTPRHTVLIDTATGNDKVRPGAPAFDHLDEPFLDRLAAAGIEPPAVDHVLLTHLHTDHVGWNTRREGEAWVPTFPRARHLFSRKENAYNDELARGGEPDPARSTAGLGPMRRRPSAGFYDDSVRPIVEAGLADLVEVDGREVLEGFSFVPTPGHSVDHASIRLVSRGEEALFSGDVMHNPLQVEDPDLGSCFCEFPDAARRSRHRMLAEAADRNMLVLTSHFVETSAGRVARTRSGLAWTFV